MPSRFATSSAESPDPSRKALSRLPISSKRIGTGLACARLPLQPFGSVERRRDDALVPGAPAEIAGNRDPHLLLRRVWIVAQEFREGHQHARRAEAALQ